MKVKILRILTRPNVGGVTVHVVMLTEGLDKSRFETLLVCGRVLGNEADMSYYAAEKGVLPLILPELKRNTHFLNDLIVFIKIYKLIKKEKPQIIDTHTTKDSALGRMAGITYNFLHPWRKVKLVHTYHGQAFEGYLGRFKSAAFIFFERCLAVFTDKIITVSDSLKEKLISLSISSAKKISVIPYGFELDNFLNIKPRANGVLNIGIVARLVPIKNHRLFLNSAQRVIKDNPQAKIRFKIIGDGELRGMLEGYALGLGISDYVDFLGWKRDLVAAYNELDIISLTSLNEGTPVSLIEAMAAAKPIVATKVGGVVDLLGEEGVRGFLVGLNDTEAFARALSDLVKDKGLREKIGLSGREFIRMKFRKERLIRDTEQLYMKLLSK